MVPALQSSDFLVGSSFEWRCTNDLLTAGLSWVGPIQGHNADQIPLKEWRSRHAVVAFIIAFLLSLVAHVSAHAYERDVHYDLTKYLARWAGFSGGEAEQVAAADQELDAKPQFNPLPNQISCLKPLELAGVERP